MSFRIMNWIGRALLVVVLVLWYQSIYQLPTDMHQGEVYRIIYLHVPAAFASFALAFGLLGTSVYGLATKSPGSEFAGKAVAELGFVFTLLTLLTGSIWGKPTWGVWWTWDARLTTTFILAVLYAGYLLLWSSMAPGITRIKSTGILGVLIAIDVPIIYKSVTWWRTLHQPPSMMREGGSTMAPEILSHLVLSIVIMTLVSIYLVWRRTDNLKREWNIEVKTLNQMGA
jgi:heme exporter protein C